jgi:hypothetical protein
VLKESAQPGRGWIVRLVETAGRPTTAVLDVSRFPVDRATLCDLVENDGSNLALRAGKVEVPMTSFGFATIRLWTAKAPAALPAARAAAVADDHVELNWAPVEGAAAYDVFRSTDPDEPAVAHAFVGRVAGLQFIDRGLNLDATYYYRVAAVGAGNSGGKPSPSLLVRTSRKNMAPPAPVRDLGVVRQSGNRLMVAWRRSTESDVARYFVFRGGEPDFDPAAQEPIGEVKPGGYYLEHYVDAALAAGTTYYYRVLAEDWAGHRQSVSPIASGTTPDLSP